MVVVVVVGVVEMYYEDHVFLAFSLVESNCRHRKALSASSLLCLIVPQSLFLSL